MPIRCVKQGVTSAIKVIARDALTCTKAAAAAAAVVEISRSLIATERGRRKSAERSFSCATIMYDII